VAFAFLFFLTLIAASVLVRAFRGGDAAWAFVALAFLGPSLVLAWKDWLR
jgi:hypothetical protein